MLQSSDLKGSASPSPASVGLFPAIAAAAATAAAAWGLWIGEVLWVKGWAGLAWLSDFNWSAVPISLLIVYASSLLVSRRAATSSRVKFTVIGSTLIVMSFLVARRALFGLFSGENWDPGSTHSTLWLAELAASWLAVSAGLPILCGRLLAPVSRWTALVLAIAIAATIPLSFTTIRLFPAFNGSVDEIHAFKMGYPVFWSGFLVPISLLVGARIASAGIGRGG